MSREYTVAAADAPAEPTLRIHWKLDEELGIARVAEATSYAAFWKDSFGTVHFTASPEPEWAAWFDSQAGREAIESIDHTDDEEV